MFKQADKFNGDLSKWDTSSVKEKNAQGRAAGLKESRWLLYNTLFRFLVYNIFIIITHEHIYF